MTRKKFVKLLMAEGYSRNSANLLARQVVAKGVSYQKGYQAATAVSRIAKKFREALGPICEAAKKVGESFAAVLRATAPVFRLGEALEAYKAGMDAYDKSHGVTSQE